jgi:hypothetical protein
MEIWRYEIKPMDLDERSELSISMPRHAQLLHVETKDGQPSLWALVDPKAEKVDRNLLVYGTGHPVPLFHGKYVGTFLLKATHVTTLVFHVFDNGEG